MRSTRTTASVTTTSPARAALGPAVLTELRLNAGRLAGTLIACALALLLALLFTDEFSGLLVLWAVLGWYRYGRADTIEREELRASLGLSRADRVRGRVVLIGIEHAAVLLTVAVGATFSVLVGRETAGGGAPFSVTGAPTESQIPIIVAGALFSACGLVLAGILVGGECTMRRPGRSIAVLSILVYFLAGLTLTGPMALLGLILGFGFGENITATVVGGGVYLVLLGALLLVLRARV